jgi:hypothetical protein
MGGHEQNCRQRQLKAFQAARKLKAARTMPLPGGRLTETGHGRAAPGDDVRLEVVKASVSAKVMKLNTS